MESPSLTTVNHRLQLIINLPFSLPPSLWLLGACERLSWSHGNKKSFLSQDALTHTHTHIRLVFHIYGDFP